MLTERMGRPAGWLPALTVMALMLLAACGTDEPPATDTTDTPVGTAAPAAPPTLDADDPTVTESAGGDHVTVQMTPLEDSGMGGTLTINAAGAQPVLTVALTGASAPGIHQGHVHRGTCADRTRAVTPLEPVTTAAGGMGEATSMVDMPADSLLDGNHIVVYHEADGSPGASIVCAELPAR